MTLQAELYQGLICPACGAPRCLNRHGTYARYVLILEAGQPAWQHISIVRVICKSCGSTHALLPAEIVAFCQYSLPFLFFIFSQVFIEEQRVPSIAQRCALPVWSAYLLIRRYEQCLARISLVLFEQGCQPADQEQFTGRECLLQISRQGLNRFIHRYWQQTRRYLWQSRYHNRASPPLCLGWYELGIVSST